MECDTRSPRDLLNAIKGSLGQNLLDEGFLSSHHRRGRSFPQQTPMNCADGAFQEHPQLLPRISLVGTSEARYIYQAVRVVKEDRDEACLANFTNVHVYFGCVNQATCKDQLMRQPNTRPKCSAVVAEVVQAAQRKEKCLVMVSRRTGYAAMLNLLEEAAAKNRFRVAQYGKLTDFNDSSNCHGERYLVMLLDSDKSSESVELKCVRRALYLDVPCSFVAFKQRCGRVVRCGSHDDLPCAQRSVKFVFFTATFSQHMQTELGAFAVRALCGHWHGPKKVNYSTEPEPTGLLAVVEKFVKRATRKNINNLRQLRSRLRNNAVLFDKVTEDRKLKQRLEAGLDAVESASSEELEEIQDLAQTKTIDERRLESLMAEAAEMAPALAMIRCHAIDAGSVTQELHWELFAKDCEEDHVVQNFSNPYGIRPNFKNYPHSNLLPQFFTEILDILQLEQMPRFIAEVGSLHGHSAIQMATVLDQLGMTQVPILCIDPFTGDTNMWASYQTDRSVAGWVKIIDGRMTVFDQFMANVQFAVNRSVSKHHILPFQATSTVGARWLAQKGFVPDLIFLDSAHELDETFLELSLYFKLLKPGGILFGDDYGWPAVKEDVERFVEEHQRQHGADDPIDLRIVRAQAGATNLIWIMRKAKREPRELDEKNAADRWGRVGTAFACFSIHECWKLVEGGEGGCRGVHN
ncbi:Hypothetical protein SCF082_LOCUS17652 [Durusdinium trenchii]|uniref:Uncharacterized protein n=1 Tax=Durusdinium trenchii TaxID=1381693 RepID=A0ABP0KIW4_9DINO